MQLENKRMSCLLKKEYICISYPSENLKQLHTYLPRHLRGNNH